MEFTQLAIFTVLFIDFFTYLVDYFSLRAAVTHCGKFQPPVWRALSYINCSRIQN